MNVEDESPLGRSEATEVAEVGVAAGLHAKARRGRGCEVDRHVERGAAIICERRGQHAAVAQRNQLRDSPGITLLDERDRVWPVRRRAPIGVRAARALLAHRLALRDQLGPGRPRGERAKAFN